MTEIVLGQKYLLKGNSKYFKEKYGTSTPVARIDMEIKIPKKELEEVKEWIHWFREDYNSIGLCAILYWQRFRKENLPLFGSFYYTHIKNHGELIHKKEIDRIKFFL